MKNNNNNNKNNLYAMSQNSIHYIYQYTGNFISQIGFKIAEYNSQKIVKNV